MSSAASWIQTRSGRKVWPLALKASDVCIEDIAHHLSNLCRFTGAVSEFYSVAQHSVGVSHRVEEIDATSALWGLLHDASEAYLIDLPRPLKRHPDFAFYRTAEADAMRAICETFGLPHEQPDSVTLVDQRMLATEARDLMSPLHPDWRGMAEPYERTIRGWSPDIARDLFLVRFEQLTRKAAA